jgi:hypothetical protein
MAKLFYVLLLLLISFGLHAQSDTTSPPGGQPASLHDTNTLSLRHDSTVHHLSHRDSVRRDSINRAHRAIRDSIRLAQNKARQDSAAQAAQAAQGSAATQRATAAQTATTGAAAGPNPGPNQDSAAKTGSTAPARPPVPKPVYDVPPALSFWQKVLAANPFFNFTGTPVVEPFEIHRPASKDSLFYLLVAILFYFALIRIFFEKYFNNLMTLFFRVSLRQQQIREQVLQTPLPSLLLNILFILSGGLYACYLLHYSRIGDGVRFWVLYAWCMLLLGSIYLVKFLVLKFVGWVFSISRATDIYIFVVFLVNKMLGIFLLPFLILITFSDVDAREIFITISMAMVFVMWIYRALAAYRPVRNEIKLTPFYFFLYLCAFEIAPLLLIYKVLLTYLEKVY